MSAACGTSYVALGGAVGGEVDVDHYEQAPSSRGLESPFSTRRSSRVMHVNVLNFMSPPFRFCGQSLSTPNDARTATLAPRRAFYAKTRDFLRLSGPVSPKSLSRKNVESDDIFFEGLPRRIGAFLLWLKFDPQGPYRRFRVFWGW